MCAPSVVVSFNEVCVQVTHLYCMHYLVSSMRPLCGVCSVCCMCLNSPVSLCVAGRCVSCVPPFSLVPLSQLT